MHGLTFETKLEAGRTRRTKTIATIIAAALLVAGCGGPKALVNNNPKEQGPPQKVELVWKGTEWKVKLNGGLEEDPKKAKTTLTANVTGPTMFEVDIKWPSSSNPPTFRNQDPLTVWEGSKPAPKQGSTQILGPIIIDKGTKHEKLIFWDLNQGNKVLLYYELHFNEPGVPPVDPIIDNGGCC